METTNDTPTAAPSPDGGSAPKNWRWIAVGAASLALMSAGLGIGVAQAQTNGDDATTTTEAPGADDTAPDADRPTDEEIEAFRACMADNGVDLPDERPARGERPERTEEEEAAFEAALEACEDLRPEGFGRHHGGPGGPGCDGPEGDEAPDAGADADAQDTAETTGS